MREIDYRGLNFTYGQLAAALSALGFSESRGKTDMNMPFRAFNNREYNTWTILPDLPDDHLVAPSHLRSAERAVEEWGVADSPAFFKLLGEAAQKEMQAA